MAQYPLANLVLTSVPRKKKAFSNMEEGEMSDSHKI